MNTNGLQTEELGLSVGNRRLLADLDVTFLPGQRWCILGRNGSGKTTLLHTLAGLRAPDEGRVLLEGESIHDLPRRRVARQLGLLAQDHEDVFPATVLQTALQGRHPHLSPWAFESADDLALACQALARVGLQTLAQREVTTLSGGERRRLGIATLLTQDPRYLLLDEPTNHLDLHQQIEVLETLAKLTSEEERCLVMVLHDLNLAARFCDHALLLYGDGRFQAGEIESLFTEANLERLYGHPMRSIAAEGRAVWIPD